MQELSVQEMENDIQGGGWIADWVRDAINWVECHSKEIGEAYMRVASEPSNFM